MWITKVSINNPVFATMVMIGIAVLGLFAYNRLRVELKTVLSPDTPVLAARFDNLKDGAPAIVKAPAPAPVPASAPATTPTSGRTQAAG